MSGIPHSESLKRMERDGTMDRRRAELRDWFADHPRGTPEEAVHLFGYTFADHMLAIADAIWIDMRRTQSGHPS